jgi:energy-converting hydrogenase Eha subunit B
VPKSADRLLANATLYALAVLGGLIVAVIIILNLHIIVGLEEGYAASPVEVFESSVLVALVDVALLVAGPVLGILAVSRLRPRDSRPSDDTR